MRSKCDAELYMSVFAAGSTGLSLIGEYNRESTELTYFINSLESIDRFSFPGRNVKLIEDALNKGLSEVKNDIKEKKYKKAANTAEQMWQTFKILSDGL